MQLCKINCHSCGFSDKAAQAPGYHIYPKEIIADETSTTVCDFELVLPGILISSVHLP